MSDRRLVFRPRREPEDVIPPTEMRHRREEPTPEDRARDVEIGLMFRATMLSHQLGLEIQAACGSCPPDGAQRIGLKALRSIASRRGAKRDDGRLPTNALAAMDGAFEVLLARRACSHCEARHECHALRARRWRRRS